MYLADNQFNIVYRTIYESKEKKGNSLIENDIFNRSVGNVLSSLKHLVSAL